jgi:hypothetical protein
MDNTILLYKCQKQDLLNLLEHLASLRVFLFVSVVIFLDFCVACVCVVVFWGGGGGVFALCLVCPISNFDYLFVHVPFIVITIRFFALSWHISRFVIRVTRRVSLVEHNLFYLRKHTDFSLIISHNL